VSLILEALKKLERDKPTDARGQDVVLLAPVRWPSRPTRARWIAALLVLLLLAAAAGAVLLIRSRPQPAQPDRPVVIARPQEPGASPAQASPVASAEPPTAPAPMGVRPPSTAPRRAALPSRATPTGSPAAFLLTAIGEQDGHPVAVINDRMVRVGDALEGARIVRIGEGEVELEAGGRRFTVGF
jgi:hypothetical protein